jgi:hypothetical protein
MRKIKHSIITFAVEQDRFAFCGVHTAQIAEEIVTVPETPHITMSLSILEDHAVTAHGGDEQCQTDQVCAMVWHLSDRMIILLMVFCETPTTTFIFIRILVSRLGKTLISSSHQTLLISIAVIHGSE